MAADPMRAYGLSDRGSAGRACGLGVIFAAVLWGANASPLAAQVFPPYKGDRVTVVGVPDIYAPVRRTIETLEKTSSQRYFVAVVKNTGNGAAANDAYSVQLTERWKKQNDSYGKQLLGPRTIVVVMSVESRRINMVNTNDLRDRLGMTGPVMAQELIGRTFVPRAKAGDPVTGLSDLIRATDAWVVAHEAQAVQRAEADRARQAELAKSFDASFAAAGVRLERTRAARTATNLGGSEGTEVDRLLADASAGLNQAGDARAKSVVEASRLLRTADETLGRADERLRAIGEAKSRLVTDLPAAEVQLRTVKEAIYKLKESSLPTAGPEARLTAVEGRLDAIRKQAAGEPRTALAGLTEVRSELTALGAVAERLPAEHQRQTALTAKVEREVGEFGTFVGSLGGYGSAATQGSRELEGAKAELARAKAAGEDVTGATRQLEALSGRLKAQTNSLIRLRDDSIFWSRTVPLGTFLGVLVLAALATAVQWLRSRSARTAAETAFRKYKESIVAFSDRLDALRDRHQNISVYDPDYKEPIGGATLKVYEGIQVELARLRDRWLELMERWEKADRLLKSGGRFDLRPYREAAAVVDAKVLLGPEMEALEKNCAAPLAMLEMAHENGTAKLDALQTAMNAAIGQLETLRKADLELPRLTQLGTRQQAQIAAWREALVADPVGIGGTVEAEAPNFKPWTDLVAQAAGLLSRHVAGLKRLETLRGQVDAAEAEGIRFVEDEGRPHGELDAAEGFLKGVRSELERERIGEAAAAADAAEARLNEAAARRERIYELRRTLPESLTAARATTERLRSRARVSAEAYDDLRREHDPAAWQPLADAPARIERLQSDWDTIAARIEREAGPAEQKYRSAERGIAFLRSRHAEAEALIEGVLRRTAELTELRKGATARLDALERQRQDAERRYRPQIADIRPDAFKELDEAAKFLGEAKRGAAADRPHWERLTNSLAGIAERLERAKTAAEADLAAAAEVKAKSDRLEQDRRKLKQFLDSNVHDRPGANARFETASRRLEGLQRDLRTPAGKRPSWEVLKRQLEEVGTDFAEAERSARDDVRLAEEADRTLDRAAAAFRRAEGFYRSGFRADCDRARRLLSQAQDEFRRQRYEEAVRLAGEAETAAAEAQRRAELDAIAREEEIAARERSRRMDMGSVGGAVVGGLQIAGALAQMAAAADSMSRRHSSGGGMNTFSSGGNDWGGSSSSGGNDWGSSSSSGGNDSGGSSSSGGSDPGGTSSDTGGGGW